MKNQKGFIAPILLGILVLLLIGGSVYVYSTKKLASAPQSNNTSTTTTSDATSPTAPLSSKATTATSNLQMYRNSQYNFSLQFPSGVKIDTTSDTSGKSIFLQLPNSKGQLIVEVVKPSANCKDSTYGADPSYKTINGMDFTVYNADKYFSVKTSASAREYCTVHNEIEYKLYTVMPYIGTPVDVTKDTVLNQILGSFRFN